MSAVRSCGQLGKRGAGLLAGPLAVVSEDCAVAACVVAAWVVVAWVVAAGIVVLPWEVRSAGDLPPPPPPQPARISDAAAATQRLLTAFEPVSDACATPMPEPYEIAVATRSSARHLDRLGEDPEFVPATRYRVVPGTGYGYRVAGLGPEPICLGPPAKADRPQPATASRATPRYARHSNGSSGEGWSTSATAAGTSSIRSSPSGSGARPPWLTRLIYRPIELASKYRLAGPDRYRFPGPQLRPLRRMQGRHQWTNAGQEPFVFLSITSV